MFPRLLFAVGAMASLVSGNIPDLCLTHIIVRQDKNVVRAIARKVVRASTAQLTEVYI